MTKPFHRPFIAMMRVAYLAPSEVHANHTADHIASTIEQLILDPGDTIEITQVFQLGDGAKPEETLNIFRKARNELCRLNYKSAIDIARWFDQEIIWKLQHLAEDDLTDVPAYEQNRIFDVYAAIQKGEDPLS